MLINDLIKIPKENFLTPYRVDVNTDDAANENNDLFIFSSEQIFNTEKPIVNRKINSINDINAFYYLKATPENDKLFSDLCNLDNTELILSHLKKIFQQTSYSDFREWSCRDIYLNGEIPHRAIPFEVAVKNNNIAVYYTIAEHLASINQTTKKNRGSISILASYATDIRINEAIAHCWALLVACTQNNLEIIKCSKNFIKNCAKVTPNSYFIINFIATEIYKLNNINDLNIISPIIIDIFNTYSDDIENYNKFFRANFTSKIFSACNYWITKQYWDLVHNVLIFFKKMSINLLATKYIKKTIFKLLENEKFDIVTDILNLFTSKDDADCCFITSYRGCNNKKYYYTMLDVASATLNAKIMTWIINTRQNIIIDINDNKFFERNDNEILKKQYYPSCLDYAIINDNYTTGCVLLLFGAKSNIINYNLEYSSDIKEKITNFFFNPISLARFSAINLAKNFMLNEIPLLEVKKAIAEFSPVIAKQILSINDIFSINSTDN